MLTRLRSFLTSSTRPAATAPARSVRRRLGLETLEDRSVPAAGLGSAFAVGSTGSDIGRAIATDPTGNVYVTGTFQWTVDLDPGPGVVALTAQAGWPDLYVAKYGPDGALVWARSLHASNAGQPPVVAYDLAADSGGNVYLAGGFTNAVDFGGGYVLQDHAGGAGDGFLAKLDGRDGSTAWAVGIGTGSQTRDWANSVAVDAGGNVLVAGALGSSSTTDAFVARYDAAGHQSWAQQFHNGYQSVANGVAVDAAGAAYLTGSFRGTMDFDPGTGAYTLASGGSRTNPASAAYVVKLDAAGRFGWAVDFKAGNSGSSSGSGIGVDGSGNVVVAGRFSGAVDFDPGKGTLTLPWVANNDVFVVKFSPTGSLAWAKAVGGGDDDSISGLALDAQGGIYLSGTFGMTVDFDPGSGMYNLTSAGSKDAFVMKLDAAGAFSWAASVGGPNEEFAGTIAVDGFGNVYTTGAFQLTADFDPAAGQYPLTSAGGWDAYVWKLRQV